MHVVYFVSEELSWTCVVRPLFQQCQLLRIVFGYQIFFKDVKMLTNTALTHFISFINMAGYST